MNRFLVLLVLVGCGGEPSSMNNPPDARPADAAVTTDGGPPNWPAVAKVGGVIAIAERTAFCTELSSCPNATITYARCMEEVDHSATVQRAIPGCSATTKLETAMACMKANDFCASRACDAVLNQWAVASESQNCEVGTSSVGIGDRFEIFSGADSQCDGGIRAGGGWCTRACSTVQQCAGKGPGGNNNFGTANTCGADTLIGGKGCYPTCTSTAHCQAWYGEMRNGLRIACKQFNDGSAPSPICVRVSDNRGIELP